MTALPSLRRKILKSFSVLVGLYAVLGLILVLSINIASQTTPKLIHLNYDSISAAHRMFEAWTALDVPNERPKSTQQKWIKQFEEALRFEETNITEPKEDELAKNIRADWDHSLSRLHTFSPDQSDRMKANLHDLVAINEKGMFGLAQENVTLSHQVMLGALIYFILSLVLALFFADSLSQRLSRPLKSIAEALHRRPGLRRKLNLPQPTNLELLILTTELNHLWERLAEMEKVNVAEVVEQKGKLETLLESVEDSLLVLNADGIVSHCNEWLAKLVGLSKNQIQGQLWRDLSSNSDNYIKLRSLIRDGMPQSQQIELGWNRGRTFFSARSRKIGSHTDEKAPTLYLLHDITEKKLRDKFRADFMDLLSHELKTPLQSLGIASELLTSEKEQLPPALRNLVETISEDVDRIKAVAQEFVQVTQSQSKILKLKMEIVAINELFPEWIRPFHLLAKDRAITIELKQEGSPILWAYVDRVKFPWVISNLLSNALRFSPPNSVVQVLLTDRMGAVEMSVKDQGPGISDAELQSIFEPFYQGPIAGPSGAMGLFGVGLTIARDVVEAHEGRIEYHSVQPQGSEFRVLLPFPPNK